jgi:hypothetical protein
MLHVIILALNTDKKINVEEYKKLCHRIGLTIIRFFPWAEISPTLHTVSSKLAVFVRVRGNFF